MDTTAYLLSGVFVAGVLAVVLRLPPLVGFLAAGFALDAAGVPHLPSLDVVADLGVTLLLFSIGLKLDVRQASEVRVAILAMPFHGTNAVALDQLTASGFRGRVVAVAQYDDDARALARSGADDVLQIYDGAGAEMADRALSSPPPSTGEAT